MALLTVEGMVDNGQIRLCDHVTWPEHTTVSVVIPGVATVPHAHGDSPRFVHPAHAADFVKHSIEVSADADLGRVALRSASPSGSGDAAQPAQ